MELRWEVVLTKVFAFVLWPLVVMMVPALVIDSISDGGRAALIFFALLPHWVSPFVWLVSAITAWFEIPPSVVATQEVVIASPFFGVVLPAFILVPVLLEADLSQTEHDTLLACTILLPCGWLPLIAAIFQTPKVLAASTESAEANTRASRGNYDDLTVIATEMRDSFIGYFCAFALPLGVFLPLYVRIPSLSFEAEAILMFVLLLTGTIALLFNVSYRLGILLFSANFGFSLHSSIVMTKVAVCAVFFPVVVMLPVLRTVALQQSAHDVLLAFIIGLPSLTLLDAARIKLWDKDRHLFYQVVAIIVFVVIIPFAVLFPTFVVVDENETGAIAFLVLMLTPLCLFLIGVAVFTARSFPNLPFHVINTFLGSNLWGEVAFAVLILLIPVAAMLPFYFEAGLAETPAYVLLGYMLVIIALLTAIMTISCCVRAPSDIAAHGFPGHGKKKRAVAGRSNSIHPEEGSKSAPNSRRASVWSTRSGSNSRRGSGKGVPRPEISGPSNFQHRSGFNSNVHEGATVATNSGNINNLNANKTTGDGAAFEFRGPGDRAFSISEYDKSRLRAGSVSSFRSRALTGDSILLDDREARMLQQETTTDDTGPILMPGQRVPGTFHGEAWASTPSTPKLQQASVHHQQSQRPQGKPSATSLSSEYSTSTPLRSQTSASQSGLEGSFLGSSVGDNPLFTPSQQQQQQQQQQKQASQRQSGPTIIATPLDATTSYIHEHGTESTSVAIDPSKYRHSVASSRPTSVVSEVQYNSRALPRVDPAILSDGWEPAALWSFDHESQALVKRDASDDFLHIYDEEEDARPGDYYCCYSTYVSGKEVSHILKWPLYTTMQTRDACTIALRKLHHARQVASDFNTLLHTLPKYSHITVDFLDAMACELQSRRDAGDATPPWALCEVDLEDTPAHTDGTAGLLDFFCLFNDSFGGVVSEGDMDAAEEYERSTWVDEFHALNNVAQALSCFSYFHSNRTHLLVKVQGVKSQFTNPDFHFSGTLDPYLSPSNRNNEGIVDFYKSHVHNEVCQHVVRGTLLDAPDDIVKALSK